jgi:sortase (surface protein transpeptidase)
MTRGRHAAKASRPAGRIALLAGSLVALGGVIGLAVNSLAGSSGYPLGPTPHVAAPRGRAAALATAAGAHSVPLPVSLVIPAIGVRTRLIRLGTTSAGTLQVPKTTSVAGWYTGSARPGAIGPAVIAGHVDSLAGQGIFFQLKVLRPGDKVYVKRAGGTIAQFVITAVRFYVKTRFPTEAVYGPVPYAAIRLITCGGIFDHATGSYLSNVVAYGHQIAGKHHRNRRRRKVTVGLRSGLSGR